MNSMTPPHQCEFASAVSEAERCKNQATVQQCGAWFCNEHAGGRAKLLEAPRDVRMPGFPDLTPFEEKVFARFARNYKPGWAPHPIQLEGNKQLARVAAGFRMIKKGVLERNESCRWYLTDLGKEMAKEWQKLNRDCMK